MFAGGDGADEGGEVTQEELDAATKVALEGLCEEYVEWMAREIKAHPLMTEAELHDAWVMEQLAGVRVVFGEAIRTMETMVKRMAADLREQE